MKHKTTMILTTLLCLSPILLGLALYDQLPEMVPTHFNMNGDPDGWSSRPAAVFGLPVFMAVMNLICFWAFEQMKKRDVGRKVAPDVLVNLGFWVPAVISVTMVPMSLFMAVGVEMPLFLILNLFMGATFLVVGNYLPKCKMNAYVGIKLPWTYSSDENWRRTHRLGGFVWVAAGVVMLINCLLNSAMVTFLAVIAALLIPCVFSFLVYRKENRAKES